MRLILLLVVILTALSGWAGAQTKPGQGTGDKLHEYCGAGKSSWMESYCFRYITGILETAQKNGYRLGGLTVCPPKDVTKGEVVDAVKAWLSKHSEERQLSAENLIAKALSQAWPCG